MRRQHAPLMSRPTANLRLFVAAYPPAGIARELLARAGALALPSAARILPIEQVHLTLQFVGDTPAGALDAVIESMQRAASGLASFTLTPQRLIALPERGPKRLIAVETDSPSSLVELHRRLAHRLASRVRESSKKRPYRPHITLCRFSTPVPRLALPDDAASLDDLAFDLERIVLMRSTLAPTGATHHELAAATLG